MMPIHLTIRRMRAVPAALLSAVAVLTWLAIASAASARVLPAITGKLSKPGFTVVALAYAFRIR